VPSVAMMSATNQNPPVYSYLIGYSPETISDYQLSDISFSTCGQYLHGYTIQGIEGKKAVVITLAKSSIFSSSASFTQPAPNQVSSTEIHSFAGSAVGPLAAPSVIQRTNMLSFSKSNGLMQTSCIRQNHGDGTVVLQRLSQEGTQSTEELTRLPRWPRIQHSSVSVMPTAENDDWLQLVVNKPPQVSYSFYEPTDVYLPAIVQRKRSSIPVKTIPVEISPVRQNVRRKPIENGITSEGMTSPFDGSTNPGRQYSRGGLGNGGVDDLSAVMGNLQRMYF
jgi:hypothetical protein